MGEPAALSRADIARVNDRALKVVGSVREDTQMPRPFLQAINLLRGSSDELADELELLVLHMSQVITGDIYGGEDPEDNPDDREEHERRAAEEGRDAADLGFEPYGGGWHTPW